MIFEVVGLVKVSNVAAALEEVWSTRLADGYDYDYDYDIDDASWLFSACLSLFYCYWWWLF